MVNHGIGGLYYALNGFMMLMSFGFFRIMFYDYMLFGTIRDFAIYRYTSFWDLYPKEHHWMGWTMISLYVVMYIL